MSLAIKQPLLVAKSALNAAASKTLEKIGLLETTHLINWSPGVSSGAVIIETADATPYAGTWAPVTTVTFAAAASDPTNALGKQDYVRVQGCYAAIQHRISTVLAGGTVSTTVLGSY